MNLWAGLADDLPSASPSRKSDFLRLVYAMVDEDSEVVRRVSDERVLALRHRSDPIESVVDDRFVLRMELHAEGIEDHGPGSGIDQPVNTIVLVEHGLERFDLLPVVRRHPATHATTDLWCRVRA